MKIENIPLASVKPSPMNPRKTFDEAELAELAANIEKQGLLQPITVRPDMRETVDEETGELITYPSGYEIVCGERRYRAFSRLHLEAPTKYGSIPAIVREMTDEEAFEAMITENLQRKDVDPMEEAFAFSQLIAKGKTAEELAAKFGKSVRFVQDRCRLNSLIPGLGKMVKEGKMALTAALSLCRLEDAVQEDFFSDYGNGSYVDKATVKHYLDAVFRYIDRAPWYETDKDFEGHCGRACEGCDLNTATHGCLFYEMKTPDAGRCTSDQNFRGKIAAYNLECIGRMSDKLVRKGEPMDLGKVVIGKQPDNYYYGNDRESLETLLGECEWRGYEVVDMMEVFDGRCYYGPDDERLKEKLASGEVYRVLLITGYNSLKVEDSYWYVKRGTLTENGVPMKVHSLINELKEKERALAVEKTIQGRKALVEKAKFSEDGVATNTELAVIYAMMLNTLCSPEAAALLGISPMGASNDDLLAYTKGNPGKWMLIMKLWLRSQIAANQNTVNYLVAPCIGELARVWNCAEEVEKAQQKVQDKFDKQKARTETELLKLGYDLNGEKLTLRQHAEAMRAKHPGTLILIRVGDVYECFDKDADTASRVLGLALGGTSDGGKMAAIHKSDLDTYLRKLIKAGVKVAICEQPAK